MSTTSEQTPTDTLTTQTPTITTTYDQAPTDTLTTQTPSASTSPSDPSPTTSTVSETPSTSAPPPSTPTEPATPPGTLNTASGNRTVDYKKTVEGSRTEEINTTHAFDKWESGTIQYEGQMIYIVNKTTDLNMTSEILTSIAFDKKTQGLNQSLETNSTLEQQKVTDDTGSFESNRVTAGTRIIDGEKFAETVKSFEANRTADGVVYNKTTEGHRYQEGNSTTESSKIITSYGNDGHVEVY